MTTVQVKIDKGKASENLDKLVKSLPNGIYNFTAKALTKPRSIGEYRNYYFYLCDLIASESNTGYTKRDLHDLFKRQFILKNLKSDCIVENYMDYIVYPPNGSSPSIQQTTKILNMKGWELYIDNIKNYVKENLNLYI